MYAGDLVTGSEDDVDVTANYVIGAPPFFLSRLALSDSELAFTQPWFSFSGSYLQPIYARPLITERAL
jgi:hypothetical protein